MDGGIMIISREKILAESDKTGFAPDVLEKVAQLLGLLNTIRSHPFLKDRLALKGGTALNLFVFDMPRLSVDIDMNYTTIEQEDMIKVRPKIEQALGAVFSREGFSIKRMPDEHAGGKWQLQYQGSTGQRANLEVDVNFMFRIPLWPVVKMDSKSLGTWQAKDICVLDIHELAAGKLAALLSRRQARDLFDCHQILRSASLDNSRLRIAFVLYGAMNRKDWRTISPDDISFDTDELARQLIPTLSRNYSSISKRKDSAEFGRKLVDQCKEALAAILPFTESEQEFLNLILDKGQIAPELLTDDTTLQQCICDHPMLNWKALNVRQYKGLS
jgi:predicted nucleotidyltransferase component of viral defense system